MHGPLQFSVDEFFGTISPRIWLAVFIFTIGMLLAYGVMGVTSRLLERMGVVETIEGTSFERTTNEFGTSTARIITQLSGVFTILLATFVAITVADLQFVGLFWSSVAIFLPQLFIAIVILVVGVVVADKVELLVSERLRGVKLPEIGLIPLLAKYSVLFVAILIALSQIGVAVLALIVLLGAYALALIVFTALATQDLLASGTAGVYLLLNQPYSIGDEVKVGGQRGIVQEVDLLVTRIETDGEEHIIPNRTVLKDGIVRIQQ
ncbi:putative transporter (transmembrane protein) [Halohasta litchfieldiae]|jgi:small-conductance mechanosensitive channel|uniref:Conserved TM helix n=1 Tax=Halohasta litchfieldiae TaxID=1073996 RepID=A0A1H6RE39_9EURY|nr:mechanosensitive ion channel domain-containing protein [Halohasta litchfieldiae]ATW89697.1 putative transporter (transmembrane protein) [Halohasta litchfieldiae]SEI54089.1 Conserved TM helix [Halohasta litchfieldiae]